MRRPRIAYSDNLKNAAQYRKRVFKDFNDIYIKQDRNKTGLGESDEEKVVLETGKFIPGKLYTYDYDPLYKDVLDYYDRRPIIMCQGTFFAEGTGNNILQGINFNFLPITAKVQTLDVFYKIFESEIKSSYHDAHRGSLFLNINRVISFFTEWNKMISVFDDGGDVGYQFAHRHYIISRIQNLRYIEYDHWEWIPFLNVEDITGVSLPEIYNLYWQSRNN